VKFQQRGFTRTRALKGGVEAWKAAGYAMAA
jgi:rhodanese-related sulfurtransferase